MKGASEFAEVVHRCTCRRRKGFGRYRAPAEDAFDLESEVSEGEELAGLLGTLDQ